MKEKLLKKEDNNEQLKRDSFTSIQNDIQIEEQDNTWLKNKLMEDYNEGDNGEIENSLKILE